MLSNSRPTLPIGRAHEESGLEFPRARKIGHVSTTGLELRLRRSNGWSCVSTHRHDGFVLQLSVFYRSRGSSGTNWRANNETFPGLRLLSPFSLGFTLAVSHKSGYPERMILSFRDKRTQQFAEGKRVKAFSGFEMRAHKRLRLLCIWPAISKHSGLAGESAGGAQRRSRRPIQHPHQRPVADLLRMAGRCSRPIEC